MWAVSKQGAQAQLVLGKNENLETPQSRSGEAEEEDDIYYLTEKVPFFDMVFTKSHVGPPWILKIPMCAYPMLPSTEVPVVLRHGGKNWTALYHGRKGRRWIGHKWKDFVMDNKIKAGDACVFEVIDPGPENPVLKVFILRGDLPPELDALVDTRGDTSESPIVMD